MKTTTYYKYTFTKEPVTLDLNLSKNSGNSLDTLIEFCRELLKDKEEEHFLVFSLNNSMEVLGFTEVAAGSDKYVALSLSAIFRPAIRLNAGGILVVHNHPSGKVEPSETDKILYEALKITSATLGIELDGFLITGPNSAMLYKGE